MPLQFAADVSTAETDYGTVLLDQRSGRYWELNPTGTLVVKALLRGADEKDAVEALVAEFEIEREQAAHDVAALVETLRDSGLVTA
ncbi:lasso peptide biosynthesis PqqD family chaperone [Streptomyces sp. WAC 00631]|uniref:lasso peptide biosynthesis PqqD family chaperone n=1 Tax=unclassified Streptomyces TaxID=2593676 RepID=UPI000F7693DF|nr:MULTISPECIES: lasso peptide biosynthesis PqqD family chaperone [unclassified Streptomyces]MCC5037071.1 lasso peptide biosynthesis PqqD family chaperone [Streptomyces sp. WAC 00631]MCC9737679.1 lasso peptide biosynthesis PqqD family chaperone [Streptomyces sp. MNU89]